MSVLQSVEIEQSTLFDGYVVEEMRFKLESATRLHTDRKLAYNSNVRGTFEGRVKGYSFVDGKLVSLVEVLKADLS